MERRTLRECRHALGASQAAFAAVLGVSHESYRTWDAGRRATPPKILARARALATHRDERALLPLPVLALLIGVHVKTLRSAARDGRPPVTYDNKTTFRRIRARATPAAARVFRRSYYGRTVRPADRRCFGNGSTPSAAPTTRCSAQAGRCERIARRRRVRRVRSRLWPDCTQRAVQTKKGPSEPHSVFLRHAAADVRQSRPGADPGRSRS